MDKMTAGMNSRPTLKDIARTAGVSISTVSIVLSGKASERRISAQVAQRVQSVAAQKDYAPNLLMHSLRQGRTQILSFYNGYGYRNRGDLYMDRLMTALEQAAGARHYDILTHCDFARPVDEIYRLLNGGRADGLIFFGPQQDGPLLSLLRASRLPTVILTHRDEAGILSAVSEDMPSGMRKIASELVALGHRRIAALSGSWADAGARIAALRAWLAEWNIPLPENWVIPMSDDTVVLDDVLQTLMASPEPPTALFCWHDRVGYQMLEACERVGVAVPQQLTLVGYDGLHWPSRSPHILTSVAIDLTALAEAAVGLLDDLVTGKTNSPQNLVLPVTLQHGTTLAAPLKLPAC